jgi:hypothetical protein
MITRLVDALRRLLPIANESPRAAWRREMEATKTASLQESTNLQAHRTSAEAPRAGSLVVQRILAQQKGRDE